MVYDPDKLRVHPMPDKEVTRGHYSGRADVYDYVSGPLNPTLEGMEQALEEAGRNMRPQELNQFRKAVRTAVESTIIAQ